MSCSSRYLYCGGGGGLYFLYLFCSARADKTHLIVLCYFVTKTGVGWGCCCKTGMVSRSTETTGEVRVLKHVETANSRVLPDKSQLISPAAD